MMINRAIVTRTKDSNMQIQETVSNIPIIFVMAESLCGGLDTKTAPSGPTGRV